jgi:hypothetical protein
MTRRRRTEYHYDEVDTEALECSLTLTLREPDRRAQIVEVCLFAASHCQTKALKLKLWEIAPMRLVALRRSGRPRCGSGTRTSRPPARCRAIAVRAGPDGRARAARGESEDVGILTFGRRVFPRPGDRFRRMAGALHDTRRPLRAACEIRIRNVRQLTDRFSRRHGVTRWSEAKPGSHTRQQKPSRRLRRAPTCSACQPSLHGR